MIKIGTKVLFKEDAYENSGVNRRYVGGTVLYIEEGIKSGNEDITVEVILKGEYNIIQHCLINEVHLDYYEEFINRYLND